MIKHTGLFVLLIIIFTPQFTYCQHNKRDNDSLHKKYRHLPDFTVVVRNNLSDIQFMPKIMGTSIYAGKKTNIILVDKTQANLANNSMRQILAKVPGIHIWESDPGGSQIGIASRGLSPNRSWDFNIRQNGYDVAADPYGYPEAYYNPPMQGVQKIEIIRGQGALQYGPQFGGMVNYVLKNGSESNTSFQVESEQNIGSNQLFNTYNAVGGKGKNMHYYSFFNHRSGNGWRQNSRFVSNAAFNTVSFVVNPKLCVTAELMYSKSLIQQPGGLTDTQFINNPKQSFRNRNWMEIEWMTPAVSIEYNINKTTKWNTKIFALQGERNSVGYLQAITINDSINSQTLNYNTRTLQSDYYRNIGMESRFITDYSLSKGTHTFSAGIRLYKGNTNRNAKGTGSTQSAFDMTPLSEYPQQLRFSSINFAAFVENIYSIRKKLLIIPGIRFETIEGSAKGSINTGIDLPLVSKSRNFIIGGLGLQYEVGANTQLYSNYTQAYRPIQFSNLTASPTTDSIDPYLSDAKGYNLDLGYRGKINKFLQFDISAFSLVYNNRIGTIKPTFSSFNLITNVGNSKSTGLETYAEIHPAFFFSGSPKIDWSIFTAYSYTYAKYNSDHKDETTKGKFIENTPMNILRTGFLIAHDQFLFSAQYSYVGKVFSDAGNTILPSADARVGIIPAYDVMDCTIGCTIKKNVVIKAGINNLWNKYYFTRRASGYPGPGLMPADGRTCFVSFKTAFQ